MFVGIPPRQRRRIPWATPLLFASLWLAYITAAVLAPAGRIAATLDWGVLTGELDSAAAWQQAFQDGSVLRLVSGLFLHADWIHLLGNLIFLLLFSVLKFVAAILDLLQAISHWTVNRVRSSTRYWSCTCNR